MITRRETLTTAAALALATGPGCLGARAAMPTPRPPQPYADRTRSIAAGPNIIAADRMNRSQLMTALATVVPALQEFSDKPLTTLIKEKMATVDLGHLRYPPTAVEELIGDIGSLADQMLNQRRELMDLERLAYQTAADITNNNTQLGAERDLVSLSPKDSLTAQQTGYDNATKAVASGSDALANAFSAQAAGLRESVKAQIAQIDPATTAQQTKLTARKTYWDNLATITTDDDSDLSFSKRRARLVGVILDCIEELYQKAFSLQVGITQLLVRDPSSNNDPDFKRVKDQFADYNSPDVVERLVLWARAAGRFIERRAFERIITTAVIPLFQTGIWGNKLLPDTTDWDKDAPFDSAFTITENKHLPADGDPRIVGIGVQLGQQSMHGNDPAQMRIDETVRSAVTLQLPKTSINVTAPFNSEVVFTWNCQPLFTLDTVGIFDVDTEVFSHPVFRNLSPFGDWRIKLPQYVVSKARDDYKRSDYAKDAKLILRLSTALSA
jgi:hypothetical protein